MKKCGWLAPLFHSLNASRFSAFKIFILFTSFKFYINRQIKRRFLLFCFDFVTVNSVNTSREVEIVFVARGWIRVTKGEKQGKAINVYFWTQFSFSGCFFSRQTILCFCMLKNFSPNSRSCVDIFIVWIYM